MPRVEITQPDKEEVFTEVLVNGHMFIKLCDEENSIILIKSGLEKDVEKLVSLFMELPKLDRRLLLSYADAFKVRRDIEISKGA